MHGRKEERYMAKAEITITSIDPRSTYFMVTFKYKTKAGYLIRDTSIRIYYSTSYTIDEDTTPYTIVDVLNYPNTSVLSTKKEDGYTVVTCRVPASDETQLSQDTTYWLRARLSLFSDNGGDGKWYKWYRGPKSPVPETTTLASEIQPLFCIAKYSHPHTGDSGETEYEVEWIDFTKHIVAPTYDVNYEDVNEDWTNADYVTKRIVPRTKITGSLEMKFLTRYDYNNFLALIKQNRSINGKGYIQLRVQVNNDLEDINSGIMDLATRRCVRHIGMFFMKMENNPLNVPFFGHLDQYEALRLELEEA